MTRNCCVCNLQASRNRGEGRKFASPNKMRPVRWLNGPPLWRHSCESNLPVDKTENSSPESFPCPHRRICARSRVRDTCIQVKSLCSRRDEFAVQPKSMIKNAQTQNDNSSIQLTRMTRMLRRIKVALDGCAGISATYRDMEDWTGVHENTIKDWFNGRGRPTAEFLIELMDRIPAAARQQILATTCRTLPTLAHPQTRLPGRGPSVS
jgi:hypothetical protein